MSSEPPQSVGSGELVIAVATATGLQNFASRLIRHIRAGVALDDEMLADIRTRTLLDAKNTEPPAFPIEQQAEIMRQSAEALEKIIDVAISEGKSEKL